KPWHLRAQGEGIPADYLLVGAPGTPMDSANGAVRLTLGGDIDGKSPLPIVEPAVIPHEAPKNIDLDFTLDRGRADVANRKKEGAANVRVRVRDQTFDLLLHDPGTDVAVEMYSRWPAGARFKRKPGPEDVPLADVIFLVLKGRVTLQYAGHELAMSAPPGPAYIEWDNVDGL